MLSSPAGSLQIKHFIISKIHFSSCRVLPMSQSILWLLPSLPCPCQPSASEALPEGASRCSQEESSRSFVLTSPPNQPPLLILPLSCICGGDYNACAKDTLKNSQFDVWWLSEGVNLARLRCPAVWLNTSLNIAAEVFCRCDQCL